MEIFLAVDRDPELRDSGNFRALKTTVPAGMKSGPGIARLAGKAGQVRETEEGLHMWVDPLWLRGQYDPGDSRLTELEAMIAYAAGKGWTSPDGLIRSHVEWRDTD